MIMAVGLVAGIFSVLAPSSANGEIPASCTRDTVLMEIGGVAAKAKIKMPKSYFGGHVPKPDARGIVVFDVPVNLFVPSNLENIAPECLPHKGTYLKKLNAGIGIFPRPEPRFLEQVIERIKEDNDDLGAEGQFHVYCRHTDGPCQTKVLIPAPGVMTWPIIASCIEEKQQDGSYRHAGCNIQQAYPPHLIVTYGFTDPKAFADLKNFNEDIGDFVRSLSPDTSEIEQKNIGKP